MTGRPLSEGTLRCRDAIEIWDGGELTSDQIAEIAGLVLTKRTHNSIDYLVKTGRLRRVGCGVFRKVLA